MTAETDRANGPTLCADIGASNVRAGVAEGSRVIHIVERRIPELLAAHGGDMVLAVGEALAEVQASIDAAPRSGPRRGGPIGIGVPAIVLEGGSLRVGLSSGLPAGTTLRDRLSERFEADVVVDNDASLAALGELLFGAGTGERSLALLTLGTNIGMGIVVDGRIYRGAHGAAGEIGTVPLRLGASARWELIEQRRRISGQSAPPPGYAWLEEVYGGQALADAWSVAASSGGPGPSLSMPRALQSATAGDEAAREIVAEAVQGWALAIATTCNVLDPNVVLLGGGIAADLGPYLGQLRREVEGLMPGRSPPVEMATLGPLAGLIGAAAAARLSRSSPEAPPPP
jgi:predicted NBD/HSP70 family sugar kinase